MDPGFVEWEDFRTEEQLGDQEEREKWKDSAYRLKKETEKRDDEDGGRKEKSGEC